MIFGSYVYNTATPPPYVQTLVGATALSTLHVGFGIDAADGYTTAAIAGPYTVTSRDNNSCCGGEIVLVNIPAPLCSVPVVLTPVFTNPSCGVGNDGTAGDTVVGGLAPYTYLWTPGGQTTQNITGLTAGTYTVSVTDANCCTTTASVTLVANSLAISTNIIGPILCNGGLGSVDAVITLGGTPPFTYTWTPVGGTNAAATGLSAGSYTVTVNDAGGCSSTASINLTEPAPLSRVTSVTAAACGGLGGGNANVVVGGGTPGYTYSWLPNGGNGPNATGLSAGTYTINIADANGCTTSTTVTINNVPQETVAINTVSDITCFGLNNGNITTTTAGGTFPYTYAWTPVGGVGPNASNLSAGCYTFTVTDANGCVATASACITEPQQLIISPIPPQTICIGQTATITPIVNGDTLPYTYAWSDGSTTSSVNESPILNQSYTLVVTDANGCISAPATVTITVNPPLSVVMGAPPFTCPGGTVSISATASGGDGSYNYTWNPGALSGPSVNVTPASTTEYTVVVTDNCGTPAITDSVLVTLYPLPVVSFSALDSAGCYPFCTTFSDRTTIASGSISYWLWNFGNGIGDTMNVQNPNKCFPTPGKYTVTLTTTSDKGCVSTQSVNNMVTSYNHPTAQFTESPQPTTILDPVIYFKDKSIDNYGLASWDWTTFGDQTDSTSSSSNPVHTYQDTGTYCASLIVTNIHGCVDSTVNCVIIGPQFVLYIPDAFTPNGNGLNDIFQPKGQFVTTFTMYIFNRWGEIIYTTNDINKGWDGAINNTGPLCQEDTYIYVINATDSKRKQYNYTGRVSLLK